MPSSPASKGSGGSGGNGGTNVRVVCRFRPQNSREDAVGGKIATEFSNEDTTVRLKHNTDHTFHFDRIFPPASTQEQVYEYSALPTVKDVFNGYNGTIFVYGQTSSGKTHTMMGPEGGKGVEDPTMKGIIPRMVSTIFQMILEAPESIEFLVKVSYLEIYMERIKDLLDSSKGSLQVREDKSKGIWIEGATEVYVSEENEVFEVMKAGTANRAIAETNMNSESSRSHSIFVVTVQQRNAVDMSNKTGKLYLVDLAGSEKVLKTGAKGQTLEEAKMINKSLSALGNVINALTDGKSKHIPYRDSKLTRVLQESLGGNARTTLVINCSPSSHNEQESLSTLRFGTRAKSIKNKAKVNQERSVEEMKLLLRKSETRSKRLEKIVEDMERELAAYRRGGAPPPTVDGARDSGEGVDEAHISMKLHYELQEKLDLCEQKMRDKEDECESLTAQVGYISAQLRETAGDLEVERHTVEELGTEYAEMQVSHDVLAKENDEIISEMAHLTIQIEKYQFEAEETQISIQTLEETNKQLSNDVVALQAHLSEAQTDLEKKTQAKEVTLSSSSSSLSSSSSSLSSSSPSPGADARTSSSSSLLTVDDEATLLNKVADLEGKLKVQENLNAMLKEQQQHPLPSSPLLSPSSTSVTPRSQRLRSRGTTLPTSSSSAPVVSPHVKRMENRGATSPVVVASATTSDDGGGEESDEVASDLVVAAATTVTAEGREAVAPKDADGEDADDGSGKVEGSKDAEVDVNAVKDDDDDESEDDDADYIPGSDDDEGEGEDELVNELQEEVWQLQTELSQQTAESESIRNSLTDDLRIRCSKVVELKLSLDILKRRYAELASQQSTEEQRERNDFLERNLKRLIEVHEQLVQRYNSLRLEYQLSQRKLRGRDERIRGLESMVEAGRAQTQLMQQRALEQRRLPATGNARQAVRARSSSIKLEEDERTATSHHSTTAQQPRSFSHRFIKPIRGGTKKHMAGGTPVVAGRVGGGSGPSGDSPRSMSTTPSLSTSGSGSGGSAPKQELPQSGGVGIEAAGGESSSGSGGGAAKKRSRGWRLWGAKSPSKPTPTADGDSANGPKLGGPAGGGSGMDSDSVVISPPCSPRKMRPSTSSPSPSSSSSSGNATPPTAKGFDGASF
eukprot:TRINITY_DN553_c1_g3_i1.p1 TRINITY_DN553_c1_g3~~TRINITY_DN553_c1_g3_i1.p1  ORF type:complete len:1136 (+),score=354.11 TRINITY_DN553_c1_g3_i1:295-3702(+)